MGIPIVGTACSEPLLLFMKMSLLPWGLWHNLIENYSPNPPVTAVRREIFPHPCNPHNKKGLSYLSDKTGIPWQRGIQKVRDVHCKRSQCLSANKTDLSVIFSNSVCTLHKLSHWICIIISRVQMRKQGLPMVPTQKSDSSLCFLQPSNSHDVLCI